MPRGDKSSYTDKQKRQSEHIEEGYEHRGVGKKEAERRAWATVNKETGGGNKSGSGRGVPDTNVSSKRGGRIGGPARWQGIGKAARRGAIARRKEGGRNPQAKRNQEAGSAQDVAEEVASAKSLRPSLRAVSDWGPSLRGANGSRERAPDDRLRDEAIHCHRCSVCGLLRFARNDVKNSWLRDLAARFRPSFAKTGSPLLTIEGAGNAGRSMHPQPRMQNKTSIRA